MSIFTNDKPYVIFQLHDEQFAISSKYVREMIVMPKTVSIPQTPVFFRGVINIRGCVIPVVDLRLKLGMISQLEETAAFIKLLEAREKDHTNWIQELESSVRECRKFNLATDPHQCAFGKWYDTFTTDNLILSRCLTKFDLPHQKIHGIAIKVKHLEEREDFDAAYELINRTKENELREMIKLFSEARSLLIEFNREIAIVLEIENRTLALSVDSVKTVEKLSECNIEKMPSVISTKTNNCITAIGKRNQSKDLVHLLDAGKLFDDLDGLNLSGMESVLYQPPTC